MSATNAVTLRPVMEVTSEERFSREDIALIRDTVCRGASDAEFRLFINQAVRTGLDPLARQIYSVPRGNSRTIQTGIDGYRLIAQRTGEYAGSDDAIYDAETEAHPDRATVTVWRLVAGEARAFTATARWSEYKPASGQDQMWQKMPYLMLAKCFDEETEVLTDRGFQGFAGVTGRVMQVTEQGLEPSDARPFSQAYGGEMVTLESDDLNFSVTPNHDMLTTAGKIEAGALYEAARSRPAHWIPRTVKGTLVDAGVTDAEIVLSAAYLADGYDRPGQTFAISVSRPHKVERLRELGGYIAELERKAAGDAVVRAGRTITTKADKRLFTYPRAAVSYLCEPGKRLSAVRVLSLSRRQARLFVDTLVAFDGHTQKGTGVRRFYTSRLDHLEAFEMASVIAGYAVSQRRARYSDISTGPNYHVTISDRDEIAVLRWGRAYQGDRHSSGRKHTGLELTPNVAGKVWCVTVPSGVIVVRRHGFSMLCGNCAEALALRKAFPQELSGLYTNEEMDQAGTVESTAREVRTGAVPVRAPRPPVGGSSRAQLRETVARASVVNATRSAPAVEETLQDAPAGPDDDDAVLRDELRELGTRGFDLNQFLTRKNKELDDLTRNELEGILPIAREVVQKRVERLTKHA